MIYNPEMGRLRLNLTAIAPQVDLLVLFDNASLNIAELRSLIAECVSMGMRVVLFENAANVGMAVALNWLAGFSCRAGAEAIVFLDQDSVAAGNLVDALARQMGAGAALASPLVVDRNVEQVEYDPLAVYPIKRPITSGSMVDLLAWRALGGYDERLFVDWVDNEFCDHLRAEDYSIVRTHETSILHEMGSQEYAWSGPGRDHTGAKRARRKYYRQNYPAWRWEDRARAQAITIRKYGLTAIGLEELALFVKATVGRAVLLEPNRFLVLRAIMAGFVDGATSRSG